ncbi:hypothetical protein ONZ45_g5125 [Pleurotus djamor]|nr:hypothetical protein ONZ45_g5125 [Pleurotus djamor]
MARNEEKAQSMLYRFREAQAAELGLGTRSDRRPRMASACKSLRECERWRGEILREISRKVSKIQDSGLTDYEVRDLNDEINKLLREKRHWENQIVALGGANYRRNVAMLDDDGKEVPGTKGYKYFGRAKDLPGGPPYYGDMDENDGELLKYEEQAELEEWEEAYNNLREALGLPSDQPIPKLQLIANGRPPPPDAHGSGTKRKASEEDDVDMEDGTKRTKSDDSLASSKIEPARQHAQMAASYITFLDAESLLPPKMPTREEMEKVLLELRKKALVEEYFGEETAAS